MAASLKAPMASSLINDIARKRQEDIFPPSLAKPLMKNVLGKGVRRAVRGYENMDKHF